MSLLCPETLISVLPVVRALPFGAYLFSLALSLKKNTSLHLRLTDYNIKTAEDQTSSFSSVSRSQLLMYKMKQCYKANKNVLPLDSPTVNIWPLISPNILHNYVWL